LLVFLRPKILRDQAATEAVSAQKYNEIREQERTLHKGKITLLPGEKQPAIPPYSNKPGAYPNGTNVIVAPAPQPVPGAQPLPSSPVVSPPQPAPPTSQPAPATQPAVPPQPAVGPQPAPAPQPEQPR
jgi:hypothetical protein